MSFNQSLYRNSVWFFLAIPVFAVWGFWVTYFRRPPETLFALDHIHGLAMFAWCAMLIAQAGLIRGSRGAWHRALGKVSYVLAPVIILSTISLAHLRLEVRGLTPEGLYILGLQLFLVLQFAVFYALAIRHRRRRDVHARWMVCTALTLLDPIFARIILVNFLPVPIETLAAQYWTFALIDAILLWLAWRDWRESGWRDVFLPALALVAVTQVLMLNVLNIPAWTAFAGWYLGLPLS